MSKIAKEDIKRIDIKEFVDGGFLLEVNRQFFHPLGLALEVIFDEETKEPVALGGIWDYRSDPEGINYLPGVFNKEEIIKKHQNVKVAFLIKNETRKHFLGSIIQPIEELYDGRKD